MFCSLQFLHGLCVEDEEEITGLRNAEKELKERTKNLDSDCRQSLKSLERISKTIICTDRLSHVMIPKEL